MKITKHGEERVRERLGIPKKAVEREIERVMKYGRRRTEFKGPIRAYLDHRFRMGIVFKTYADVWVYGNNIYLISGEQYLITAWPIPKKYRNVKRVRHYEEEAA